MSNYDPRRTPGGPTPTSNGSGWAVGIIIVLIIIGIFAWGGWRGGWWGGAHGPATAGNTSPPTSTTRPANPSTTGSGTTSPAPTKTAPAGH